MAGVRKAELDVKVEQPNLREFLAEAKAFEPKLATELRKSIRDAGKTIVSKVQSTVREGSYETDTGLRERISAGVRLEISTAKNRPGIRIRQTGSGMDDSARGLASAWDGPKPIRHPVFGDVDTWVEQEPHPYFFRTIANNRAVVTAAVEQAMQTAAEAMERA